MHIGIGATRVLLPGHVLPKGARAFEVTMKRVRKTGQDPLLPFGRLANLLDAKLIWENGQSRQEQT